MLHQSVIRPPTLTGSADSKTAQTRSYLVQLTEQIQNVFDSIGSNDYSAEFAKYTSDISALQQAVKTKAGRAALTDAKAETKKALEIVNGKLVVVTDDILLHANDILVLQSGVEENAASIVLANGRIDANAQEIALQAGEMLTLQSGVEENTAAITLANGRIDANANEISLVGKDVVTLQAGVDENAASITLANDRITANAEAIALKADQASLDLANGRIDAQANEIALKADKIDLQGLVTATELETVKASISNLTSGLTTATVINSYVVNSDQFNGTYGSFDSLTHNGALVSQRSITMGSLSSVGKALSTGGELDLSHSHAVTVNDDGTITLGEVSATGGNFKIADTKAYKDGVSAAYGNGYNTGFADGKDAYLPTAINRTGYSTTNKTVTVRALNAHQDLLTGQVIDASEIYDAGYSSGQTAGKNAVTLSKSWSGGILTVKASNGKTSTAQIAKGAESWDGDTVSIPVLDGSGSTGYTITVDAYDRYKAGWNEFRAACTKLTNVYTISQYAPSTLYMQVDGNYTSVGSSWVQVSTYNYAYKIPSAIS